MVPSTSGFSFSWEEQIKKKNTSFNWSRTSSQPKVAPRLTRPGKGLQILSSSNHMIDLCIFSRREGPNHQRGQDSPHCDESFPRFRVRQKGSQHVPRRVVNSLSSTALLLHSYIYTLKRYRFMRVSSLRLVRLGCRLQTRSAFVATKDKQVYEPLPVAKMTIALTRSSLRRAHSWKKRNWWARWPSESTNDLLPRCLPY